MGEQRLDVDLPARLERPFEAVVTEQSTSGPLGAIDLGPFGACHGVAVRDPQVRGVPEQHRRQLAITGRGDHGGESFDGPRRGPVVIESARDGERLAVQASRLVEIAGRFGHMAKVRRGEHDVHHRIEALGQRTRRLMAAGGLGELPSLTVDEAKTVDRRRLGDGRPSSRASSTATRNSSSAASTSPRSSASDPSLVLIVDCQPRSP